MLSLKTFQSRRNINFQPARESTERQKWARKHRKAREATTADLPVTLKESGNISRHFADKLSNADGK